MEVVKELFSDWLLETWANVLEVIGFIISIAAIVVGLIARSEISKLKRSHIFDASIKRHLKNLGNSADNISTYLSNYENNIDSIRIELSKCIAELEDLRLKIEGAPARKTKQLVHFIRSRRSKPFVARGKAHHPIVFIVGKYFSRYYQTSYDDVWSIYNDLIEIIRRMENVKRNRNLMLRP